MSSEPPVSDTFTLSGEYLDRLRQALKVVADQARIAQSAGYGRNVADAPTNTEELALDQLVRIDRALDDDTAEADYPGDAGRRRGVWHPLYRAA